MYIIASHLFFSSTHSTLFHVNFIDSIFLYALILIKNFPTYCKKKIYLFKHYFYELFQTYWEQKIIFKKFSNHN